MEQDQAWQGRIAPGGDAALARAVLDALRRVADPEVGENIVELGLVERIDARPESVAVELVLTSVTCPMGDLILDEAEAEVRRVLPEGVGLSVTEAVGASWTPERMSAGARRRLGWEDA